MSTVDDLMLVAEVWATCEFPPVTRGTYPQRKAALRTAIEAALRAEYERGRSEPAGDVVVTKAPDGQIVAVTRQDEEGRILSVIAESSSREREHDAEPVVWMGDGTFISHAVKQTSTPAFAARYPTPLYASPPKRKPLTVEQIDAIPFDGYSEAAARHRSEAECLRDFARSVERAQGIGDE
jgi:hypothetical protein